MRFINQYSCSGFLVSVGSGCPYSFTNHSRCTDSCSTGFLKPLAITVCILNRRNLFNQTHTIYSVYEYKIYHTQLIYIYRW